jgi:hypothetical protein
MVGRARKSHGGEIWIEFCVRFGKSGSVDPYYNIHHTVQISSPSIFIGFFPPWKGSSEARNFEVINGLQNDFEKWVERCKKCIVCQGRYFEKETVRPSPHLHKVPTRSNKVNPRTMQMTLVRYQRFRGPCCLHLQGEGSMDLWNVGILPHYMASQPKKTSTRIVTTVKTWSLVHICSPQCPARLKSSG